VSHEYISIRGAREHNLKGFDLDIPRDQLVVITGLSGSGKSSLAFDTIYAEGQRRYVESLSAYARQFLGQMDKPDVDHIEGLSPAVSIDQKTTSRNPRSTVGTVTEIYDYLRLLYARVGIPHCPICGRPIERQTSDQIVDRIMEMGEGTKFQMLAPVVRGRKGEFGKLLDDLKREGFVRVRVDTEVRSLDEEIILDKKFKHDIDVIVDRLVMKDTLRTRLADSVETALRLSGGTVVAAVVDGEETVFSQALACPVHGVSMDELAPRDFSFNGPELPAKARKALLEGLGDTRIRVDYLTRDGRETHWYSRYEGALTSVMRRHEETESEASREKLEEFMAVIPCKSCGGTRLKPEILAVTFGGKNISEVTTLSAKKSLEFFENIELSERDETIARRVIKEILGHRHSLGRRGATHPPGDSDRIRAHGRALHPGRALDWPASARQRPAHRHDGAAPRSRQHRHRGRA